MPGIRRKVAVVGLMYASLVLPAKENDVPALLRQKSEKYYQLAVQVRRDLHSIPETCFQEEQTSRYILNFLEKLPLDISKNICGHGIKAVLHGKRPTPVIAIRADMDGLPIEEKTAFPFSSRNIGRAHACGHDVHMAGVLITAKILAEMRDRLPGTAVFLFQPCEEGTGSEDDGGAMRMVAAGVLEKPKVDAMLGLHVLPDFPAGSIALRPGAMMANLSWISIVINGKSSHGAFPHQGIDAIYVAATAIMQFQSLISRSKDPKENAVLSIGMIQGGVRSNVIAERVEMQGTARSFSFNTQKLIEEGMEKILKGLAVAHGITYQYKFSKANPYVKNDARLTGQLLPLFRKILGEKMVRQTDALTISEDFAVYSHRIPSLFFFLGTGRQEALHSSGFDVDESILKTSPLLFSAAAMHLMTQGIAHDQD